jgi:hypothetical protein
MITAMTTSPAMSNTNTPIANVDDLNAPGFCPSALDKSKVDKSNQHLNSNHLVMSYLFADFSSAIGTEV